MQDKTTKAPFDRALNLGKVVHQRGLSEPHNISLYPGIGTIDGVLGDHILLAPPYNITEEEARLIVERTAGVILEVLDEVASGKCPSKSYVF